MHCLLLLQSSTRQLGNAALKIGWKKDLSPSAGIGDKQAFCCAYLHACLCAPCVCKLALGNAFAIGGFTTELQKPKEWTHREGKAMQHMQYTMLLHDLDAAHAVKSRSGICAFALAMAKTCCKKYKHMRDVPGLTQGLL